MRAKEWNDSEICTREERLGTIWFLCRARLASFEGMSFVGCKFYFHRAGCSRDELI